MNTSTVPTALLCMPADPAQRAVRAAMMTLKIIPQDLPAQLADIRGLTHSLSETSRSVAIIDLDAVRPAAAHIFALAKLIDSPAARKRVILARPLRGLWPAEWQWAQQLGFADMHAHLDSISLATTARSALNMIANLCDIPLLEGDALTRYFSAMQIFPDTASLRGQIRASTGLSAEDLCMALTSNVKSLNRIYHLRSYPSCFLGTEATAWMARQYALSKAEAVMLGRALQALCMLHHVVHEQPFDDAPYFYRTAASTTTERIKLGELLSLLASPSGVELKDRFYLGTRYDNCFVGSEAVDWLKKHYKIKRHVAEVTLNRLHGFNLIEHVTHDHPVRDGMFFYRFVAW